MNVSVFRTMVIFVAGAMTAAVLAQAQQVPKDSKAAAEAAAPAASSVNQSATDSKAKAVKEASAAQKPTDPSPVLLRDAANAGFKPEHIRGNLMFCRTTTEVGSRFPVRTCYGEEQVKIKIEEYQAERNQLQQQNNVPRPCVSPGGGSMAGAATC